MLTEEIWQTTLGQLQMQMTRATFDTWVKHSRGLAYEDGLFVVGVPSGYAKDWLENRLHTTIKRTLTNVLGRSVEVRYVVWNGQREELSEALEDIPLTTTGAAEEPDEMPAREDEAFPDPQIQVSAETGPAPATRGEGLSARQPFWNVSRLAGGAHRMI